MTLDECLTYLELQVSTIVEQRNTFLEALIQISKLYDDEKSTWQNCTNMYDASCIAKKAMQTVKGSYENQKRH